MSVSCTAAVNQQPGETSLPDLAALFAERAWLISDFTVRIYTGPDAVTELTPKDCEPSAVGQFLTGLLDPGADVSVETRHGSQTWPAGTVQAVHAYITTGVTA